MNKFIKAILLFSSPVCVAALVLFFIDPFGLNFNESNAERKELKKKASIEVNARLYKLIEFSKTDAEILILGDSRSDQLKASYFEERLHKKTYNLSYGGGTLPEIIETLRWVVEQGKIKQLYIGLNFNLYNEKNSMNLVPEALKLQQSTLSYLTSKYCFRASLLYCKALLTGTDITSSPPLSKDEFWEYQLNSSANNFYRAYSYPEKHFQELKELITLCIQNNIQVLFFIPPTHNDLQKKITDFNLNRREQQFKEDLRSIVKVYDFDYKNDMTLNRNNFLDPYHSIDSISKIVVSEIVTGKTTYGKML